MASAATQDHTDVRQPVDTVDRVAIALGGGATITGLQLAGLLSLLYLRGLGPSSMHRPWLLATALVIAGATTASSGTLSPRILIRNLRRPAPEVTGAWVATAGTMMAIAPWLAREGGGLGRLVAAITIAQIPIVAAGAWWSRTGHGVAVRRQPWLGATALIATFLAVSLATAALRIPDLYPLSRYPMYSEPRTGTYSADRVVFTGLDDAGGETPLPRPTSRQVLLQLSDAHDLDRLEALARRAAGDRGGLVAVVVTRETVEVAPHTSDDDIRIVDQHELLRSELEAGS